MGEDVRSGLSVPAGALVKTVSLLVNKFKHFLEVKEQKVNRKTVFKTRKVTRHGCKCALMFTDMKLILKGHENFERK